MANLSLSLSSSDIFDQMVVLSILMVVLLLVSNADATGDGVGASKVTAIVDYMCNKTSNYKNCVDTLYSDPRTPFADRVTLAYVSFTLAYNHAVETRRRIEEVLNNATLDHGHDLYICLRDYKKSIKDLQSGFGDLDSETYFTLPRYANRTAHRADDCQSHYPSFASATLKNICEICTVIANTFIGGGGD